MLEDLRDRTSKASELVDLHQMLEEAWQEIARISTISSTGPRTAAENRRFIMRSGPARMELAVEKVAEELEVE